ncbi:protein YgfX [Silvimonas sp.]|uniref:protein YgfX n=1 Tax=Silvimonas sp. TaxID=2650811 RepID=UPI0028463430|nr:protein YgfX [Silvimonas sp.]MDR3426296.1 hypothetical protein [Silvimonas sp.]
MRVTAPALHISFGGGRAGFYLCCAFAAAAALSAIALPWSWLLLAWLGTAAYLVYLWCQPTPRGSLVLAGDGTLLIGWGDESPQAAQVLGSTMVSAHLLVLHLRVQNVRKVQRLVLWPDSMPADDFRRLRVALRWNKRAPAQEQSAKQHQLPS